MKINQGNFVKQRQRLTFRKLMIAGSVLLFTVTVTIIAIQLHSSKKSMAAVCDAASYTLDWNDPSTYTVTCGTVNTSNWSVKGNTCWFYSPIIYAGGTAGEPDKEVTFSVRVNQSGNLDGNDTAWVYMKVNGALKRTFIVKGDSVSKVFAVTQFVPVPADGNASIEVKLKNDKTNELWQIKSNEVTACIRTLNPLPISLSSFTAQSNSINIVDIDWSTMAEVNNDYFSLERSADGIEFNEIHKEKGAGNSSSLIKYSYTDENPFVNINYYRLRQVDYDGQSTTSKIIKVNVSKKTKTKNVLSVYPNPASENTNILFHSEVNQQVSVILSSQAGKVLLNNINNATEGENNIKFAFPSNIKPGSYIIRVTSKNEIIGSKTIIVK